MIRRVVAQPTERQQVGNQIDGAMVLTPSRELASGYRAHAKSCACNDLMFDHTMCTIAVRVKELYGDYCDLQ